MKVKCEVFSYKFHVTIKKPWYMTKYMLHAKANKFIKDFPNYLMGYDSDIKTLIIDIYFDETGFNKEPEREVHIEVLEDSNCIKAIWI